MCKSTCKSGQKKTWNKKRCETCHAYTCPSGSSNDGGFFGIRRAVPELPDQLKRCHVGNQSISCIRQHQFFIACQLFILIRICRVVVHRLKVESCLGPHLCSNWSKLYWLFGGITGKYMLHTQVLSSTIPLSRTVKKSYPIIERQQALFFSPCFSLWEAPVKEVWM